MLQQVTCSTWNSSDVPSATASLEVIFKLVNALEEGNVLQLLLPGGASAGTHAGTTCVSDAVLSSCDAGGRLPSDVTLSCVLESGQVAFEWTAGVAGIPAGSYTTIFETNAAATVQYSQFVLQTWQDSSIVTQIDAPAAIPSPASTRELFQYLSGTFTAHAAANTSVVFALELTEDLAASFSIYITAPCDLCEASVGPDRVGIDADCSGYKVHQFP